MSVQIVRLGSDAERIPQSEALAGNGLSAIEAAAPAGGVLGRYGR